MNERTLYTRFLSVVGLAMMAINALAIVGTLRAGGGGSGTEGLLGFLFGSGLVALGAFLGRSRYRRLLYLAPGLTICGLIAVVLTILRYSEAQSLPWRAYVVFARPICGGIMSCVGAVLVIVESFRRTPVHKDSVEAT